METTTSSAPLSKKILWTSRVMVALPALLMLFSAAMKFAQPPEVAKGFEHLGWSMNVVNVLGVLLVVCTVIYLVPRTAILGAILLTGYLGGAIATCVRVGDAYIPQVIMGVVLWGGLYLRDPRLRALIPLTRAG
jgi:hypothetical protein